MNKFIKSLLVFSFLVAISVYAAYPLIEFTFDSVWQLIIPTKVEVGQKNIGDEFVFMAANITTPATGGWVSFAFVNSTGPVNDTVFWIKDPTDATVTWDVTSAKNITNPVQGLYKFYARGTKVGRAKAWIEVKCGDCIIAQGNTTYNFTSNTTNTTV